MAARAWCRTIDPDRYAGANVTSYPEAIRFRVTASTRNKLLDIPLDVAPSGSTKEPPDLNQFLLGLQFQIKMFHGLTQTVFKPEKVQLIGVPEEVPSDERVYEVTFSLRHVPITDRCLLEVASPAGERLARFHLDLL